MSQPNVKAQTKDRNLLTEKKKGTDLEQNFTPSE